MRISCRASTWASLAACFGLSMFSGCGGSSTPAPAPAPAAAAATNSAPPEAATAGGASDAVAMDGGNAGATGGMPGSNDEVAGATGGGMMPIAPGGGTAGMDGGMLAGGGMPDNYGMNPNFSGGGGPNIMGGGPGMGGGMPGMGMPGMGGMGGMAIQDPAPAEDADYMSKGKYAFAIGKEVAAESYVIAELLANEATAASILQQVRFSLALRKPTFALRFGVGVNLEAPTTITDYMPIGRTPYAKMNGQGGPGGGGESMGMMGMGGGNNGQGGTGQKNLGDLTGRFGDELIKAFEGAWDSGTFGSVFADVDTITPLNRLNPNGLNQMGGMGMSGMSGDGMAMAGGMPGMGMPGMGGPGMGGPENGAPPSEALRTRATPGKAIVPGLTYLGTGKESELLGKAEADGIDYLFFFEVDVKAQRQRIMNDSKLRLIAVKEKKNLGATSTLNNNKVDAEMATKGDSDDVAKQIGLIFKKLDTVKLQDMPKLKPESAQARVKMLIEKKTKDVLPILMEIKLYHSQGALNDEERDAAYQLTLLNGLVFVNGSPEDRAFVLEPLLPGYK